MYSYNKNKRKLNYMILIIMILVVSVGYAILSTNLNILGSSQINAPTWDIHWENVSVKTGSVTASIPTIDTAKTTVNYSVTFTIPGEYYEFTVDAVNVGTIDGMVSVVSNKLNNVEITTIPNYLEYKVSYEDGVDIAPNHLLEAGTSEKYKVHVGYKKDINVSDMPEGTQTLNLSFSVTYVQSDSNGIPVDHSVIVYTGNKLVSNNVENSIVQIGKSISPSVLQFTDSLRVIEAIGYYPIYLKHKVSNGVVTESYVNFYMNEELAEMVPGVTAGVYSLQGGGASYNEQSGEYNNDSKYFENNKALLQTALGNAVSCVDGGTEYSCSMMGVTALVKASGYVEIDVGNVIFAVKENGISFGEGETLLEPSTLYTFNEGNLNKDESIPDFVRIFGSSKDLFNYEGENYCLKHKVEGGLIIDSYVYFEVTESMANNNAGMTVGTYSLKGSDSSAYDLNKQLLLTAFGASNCQDNNTSYSCAIDGFVASASSNGAVKAGKSQDDYCGVEGNTSCCFEK